MTRKFYKQLAEALARERPSFEDERYTQWRCDVIAVSNALRTFANYNPSRFLEAAGFNTGA